MKVNKVEEQKRTISYILNNFKYGDTINDKILSKLLGYNIRYDKQYKRYIGMMNRIKIYLIEYSYIIKRVKNGWYILKPAQIGSYCYRKNIVKAHNTIKRGINIIQNVDASNLSTERLKELEYLEMLSETLDRKMTKTIESSKYYSRKAFFDTLGDI